MKTLAKRVKEVNFSCPNSGEAAFVNELYLILKIYRWWCYIGWAVVGFLLWFGI